MPCVPGPAPLPSIPGRGLGLAWGWSDYLAAKAMLDAGMMSELDFLEQGRVSLRSN